MKSTSYVLEPTLQPNRSLYVVVTVAHAKEYSIIEVLVSSSQIQVRYRLMINRLFLGLARRLRPEVAGLSGLELVGSLIDLAAAIYFLPFAVGGLVWLTIVTDLGIAREHWIPVLVTLLANLIIRRLGFVLRLEVRRGVFALATGSFESMVLWSALLLLGPTAIWIGIAAGIIDLLRRRRAATSSRWYLVRSLLNDIASNTLSGILALRLYESLDGSIPFPGQNTGLILPVAVATAAWMILPRLMSLPLLLYLRRAPELVGSGSLADQTALTRFLLIGAGISAAGDPFAILATVIYAELGPWIYIVFVGGVILVAYLANRLSDAVARSEQRSRELALIERLARALMMAPAEIAVLSELLRENIEGLFPGSQMEIRLFPDDILYRQLPEESDADAAIWESLQRSEEDHLIFHDALPDAPGGPWDGLVVAIEKGEEDEPVGGIYVIAPRITFRSGGYLPVVQSLAHQIGSALRRIELHEEALKEQAQVYQQEVYTQAYQAEVYAQALALEKMSRELALAGQIQASFLPEELPDVPGWQVAVVLEPAREASGDFYDFIMLPEGAIGLVVADVAEKGVGAALYMALSRTLIRTFAMEHHAAPALALAAANRRILADTNSDLFVTVFYGVLEPESGILTYCNAGHNPPILLQSHNGGKPQALARTALPLGILEESSWEQSSIQLMPGDVLAMYTDGVTEAQDEENDFFGEQRLMTILQANAHRSAEVIEDRVIAAVYDFAGDAPQFDDITVMIVTRE